MPELSRTSRRLVLRDHVAGGDIRSFVEGEGWTFAGQIERDPARGVFYEAKWTTPHGPPVHYVVDETADVAYLVVMIGLDDGTQSAEAILSRIEQGLAVWSLDELLTDCYVHVYPAGWAKSLLRLGAGAPPHAVPEFVEHIVFSSQHQEARVRRAALWAMAYAAWPEFMATLTAMADTDEDPEVAREARLALELFETENLG